MKELEKMSYEELDALTEKLIEEKERRKVLAKKTFEKRYEALYKIEQAFDDYYEEFHEYPFIKYGANNPLQMTASPCNRENIMDHGIPHLVLFHK